MRRTLMIVVCVSGCGVLPTPPAPVPVLEETQTQTIDVQRPRARPDGIAGPEAQTDASLPEPEVSVGTLGRTIASLGNPAESGMWLKTPLVNTERQANVFYPATGKSVEVTLIPIEGPSTAGSRMSLAAMQALGASLGDLIEVDVFGF